MRFSIGCETPTPLDVDVADSVQGVTAIVANGSSVRAAYTEFRLGECTSG